MLCEANAEQVEQALARLRAGEGGAFDTLLELAYAWLGQRVVAILRGYPSVKLPADEVLHDRVLARLRTALETTRPQTCLELTRLADRHIRWALRDLVREQKSRPVAVSLDTTAAGDPAELAEAETAEGVAEAIDPRDRARFHTAAASLSEPLRRVFCLRYYGGLSEAEVAAELDVSDRMVRNYWREAIDQISVALTGKPFAGDLPRLRRQAEAEGSPLCPTRKRGSG